MKGFPHSIDSIPHQINLNIFRICPVLLRCFFSRAILSWTQLSNGYLLIFKRTIPFWRWPYIWASFQNVRRAFHGLLSIGCPIVRSFAAVAVTSVGVESTLIPSSFFFIGPSIKLFFSAPTSFHLVFISLQEIPVQVLFMNPSPDEVKVTYGYP